MEVTEVVDLPTPPVAEVFTNRSHPPVARTLATDLSVRSVGSLVILL